VKVSFDGLVPFKMGFTYSEEQIYYTKTQFLEYEIRELLKKYFIKFFEK
jgi:hypothetical protein